MENWINLFENDRCHLGDPLPTLNVKLDIIDYLFLPKRIVTNSEPLIRLRFFKDGGVCYVIGFGRDFASSILRPMLHRNFNKFRYFSGSKLLTSYVPISIIMRIKSTFQSLGRLYCSQESAVARCTENGILLDRSPAHPSRERREIPPPEQLSIVQLAERSWSWQQCWMLTASVTCLSRIKKI